MIVLDTNVISELMRPSPSALVEQWIASHRAIQLYATTITQVEIFYGIELLATGKQRADLLAQALPMFDQDFAGRVLPFDRDAALVMPQILAHRRTIGRPIDIMDCQIAAIARSRGAAVATRDTAGFAHCGITVIDPWAGK